MWIRRCAKHFDPEDQLPLPNIGIASGSNAHMDTITDKGNDLQTGSDANQDNGRKSTI